MQENNFIDVSNLSPGQAKFLDEMQSTKLPEDYKNELQFIFESRIAKLEQSLMLMRASVNKSRTIPYEEVHQSLICAYGELQKVGTLLDNVNHNLRWHNGDHSMYDGVDG